MKYITKLRMLMVILGMSLLCSCSIINPLPRSMYSPLTYYAWIEEASDNRLLQEKTSLDNSDVGKVLIPTVQLALVLSVAPQSAQADLARARSLLKNLPPPAGSDVSGLQEAYLDFSILWQSHLELQQTQASKSADRKRIETLEAELSELQATLNAFTSIEQQLIERELKQAQP